MQKHYLLACCLALFIACKAQIPKLNLVQLATGFVSPVDIKHCGDDRIFVVEQKGKIRIVDKSGNIQAAPFLDITAKVQSTANEQGLLGLAFSPNYKQDGFFYINYITGPGSGSTVIARYSVNPTDSTRADSLSEKVLLTFSQPYDNHNGGGMLFGHDGYLYISQGDGGSAHDPQGRGQNKNTYHGKILRLNVSNPDTTYTIPADNPFVGQANVNEEIWDYGLRNPWRISIDKLTGDLWIADVGQDYREEIDFHSIDSAGGINYGWKCREGIDACVTCNQTGCTGLSFADPVFDYPQTLFSSCSVTGGYVYRGAQFAGLYGRYIFADYCSGRFFSLKQTSPGVFDPDTLQDFTNFQVTSFGEDNNGEMYVLFRGSASNPVSNPGRIFHLTDTADCSPVARIISIDSSDACSKVSLTALQGDSLNYQWYNGSDLIDNATTYNFDAVQTGWYKVLVSKQQPGCETFSDSVFVTRKPAPVLSVTINPQTSFCKFDSSVSLTQYVTPANGIYSGTGVTGSVFNPALAQATNTINYHYTNIEGCSASYSFTLTVNDTATLQRNFIDTILCVTGNPVSLANAFTPSGGIYSGTAVTNDSIFSPQNAAIGGNVINYVYTSSGGCVSRYRFQMVVGDTTPLVQDKLPAEFYCHFDAPVHLDSFISPQGGVYTGQHVSSNVFTPSIAAPGNYVITYQYTNSFGCVSHDTMFFRTEICMGVNDMAKDISIKVLPNPSNGVFKLAVSSTVSESPILSVVDYSGKVCYKQNIKLAAAETIVPVTLVGLAKGIYTLQLTGENLTATKIIVIE